MIITARMVAAAFALWLGVLLALLLALGARPGRPAPRRDAREFCAGLGGEITPRADGSWYCSGWTIEVIDVK